MNKTDTKVQGSSALAGSVLLAGSSFFAVQQAVAQALPAAQAQEVAVAASAAAAGIAAAVDGDAQLLEAITITATRLKEVPQSVSAITGEELEKFHVNNFRDIANRIGNVRTSWNNPNTASIFIRGVGWAAGAGVLDPSVGVTVDGVSHGISSISALSNYLDVETVEVQRGPVGTDGGKQSNIGRVVINTRAPSFAPEARAAITFGELHSVIATAVIGGAIVDDKLAYRFSVNRETANGPFKNRNDTHFSWRNTDRTNVRGQFLFTPSERLEATLTLDYTPTGREICENCFTFRVRTPLNYDWIDTTTGLPGGVDIPNDNLGKIQRRWFAQKKDYTVDDYYAQEINTVGEYPNTYATRGAAANVKYEFDGGAVFKSITAFRDYQFSQGAGTHTQFEWLRAPRGTQTEFNQLSQEFSFNASVNDNLSYQVGTWIYRGKFPNYSQTERYGSDGGAWYATPAQYAALDPVSLTVPQAVSSPGWLLLLNSLDGFITLRKEQYDNHSTAAFGNVTWNATDQLTVNAGVRATKETRRSWSESGILSDGFAAELDPAVVNNVTFGGFNSNAAGVLGTNTPAQLAAADFVAQKYFGVANYAALNATQRGQIGAAKGIRAGRLGAAYQRVKAEEFRGTLPTADLGVSYKLTDDHTLFGSVRYGEKAGISQIVGATAAGGKSILVDAEKTTAFELGLKSNVLDNTLSYSAVLFLQNIKDYIQPGFVFDPVQTALNAPGVNAYLSALGNVPKARTKGVELDVTYSGIPFTTIRFAGAYTDAKYVDFTQAAPPGELSNWPGHTYVDASGKTLPGAPKFSGNLFADYSYPIGGNKVFRANINYNLSTGYYPDQTLSRYTKTSTFGVTDVLIGLGRADRRFDVGLVVKNVFNEDTGLYTTWNAYKPGIPRWVGLTANASLY